MNGHVSGGEGRITRIAGVAWWAAGGEESRSEW
jgi:hypothetical protein